MLQGEEVDAARGLAYLLNANLTLSGGCPNPPMSARLAQQVHPPLEERLLFISCPTVSLHAAVCHQLRLPLAP